MGEFLFNAVNVLHDCRIAEVLQIDNQDNLVSIGQYKPQGNALNGIEVMISSITITEIANDINDNISDVSHQEGSLFESLESSSLADLDAEENSINHDDAQISNTSTTYKDENLIGATYLIGILYNGVEQFKVASVNKLDNSFEVQDLKLILTSLRTFYINFYVVKNEIMNIIKSFQGKASFSTFKETSFDVTLVENQCDILKSKYTAVAKLDWLNDDADANTTVHM